MATLESAAPTGRDWRIGFGLATTVVWLGLGGLYLGGTVGWSAFVSQPAEALGSFLEGAFAPLAFLWLVIGNFLQQGELRSNNAAIHRQYEEMKRTAESAEVQARAIRDNALHQQQETTLMVADRVHQQLGSLVGLLWMSSQGPGNEGAASEDVIADLWSRLGSGDPETFARQFMALYYQIPPSEARELFFGTAVRTRHSRTLVEVFGRLLERVRACDPDGVIEDALLGSGHGTLYRIIRSLEDDAVGSEHIAF